MISKQWIVYNYHLTLSNIGCLRLKHPQSSKARMDQMHDRKSESLPDVTAWSNRSYQMSHSRRKYAVAQRSNDGLSIERAWVRICGFFEDYIFSFSPRRRSLLIRINAKYSGGNASGYTYNLCCQLPQDATWLFGIVSSFYIGHKTHAFDSSLTLYQL